MSKSTPQLLDVVALTVELPEYNLLRGQVGTIVELLTYGAAFKVEFSDSNGQTYQSFGLRPEQIMVLHFETKARTLVDAQYEITHRQIMEQMKVDNLDEMESDDNILAAALKLTS
ncbi:DUF4926 domain-containing protein [Anabaena sphaerica FACHB-251]|uniref:DUF4926 domain-containing protein n=1 Tax=Anabaena sphaerica FACHB-251 TaxID=2692883 RepID=A0A926WNI2_9NOST|nr:DUF4926 domain-containing protein [Anabaena sphaerica FACHB-251]